MKMITAAEAPRDFTGLLDRVSEGEAVGITKDGRMVATLNPAKPSLEEMEAFKRDHIARLRSQPALHIPRGTREELYGD